MKIALLHTAQVHVDTFDRIFAQMSFDLEVKHVVVPALLEKARAEGTEAVRTEVEDTLKRLSSFDAVMCTCSTLGPLADDVGRSVPNVLRIDRPLLERACLAGANPLVVLCLESTRVATLDLLLDCAKQLGRDISAQVLVCHDAWAFFEAGDMHAYAKSIADSIKSEVARLDQIDSIILAQASMRVAETALMDIGIPVYSSPELAADRCIQVARASCNAKKKA